MSFLDGKPRIATEEECNAQWMCGKRGEHFRCCFCGYKFKVGDYWRCQYTNSTPGASGNPLVCEKCDAPREELVAKWKAMHDEVRAIEKDQRLWWFHRRGEAA